MNIIIYFLKEIMEYFEISFNILEFHFIVNFLNYSMDKIEYGHFFYCYQEMIAYYEIK